MALDVKIIRGQTAITYHLTDAQEVDYQEKLAANPTWGPIPTDPSTGEPLFTALQFFALKLKDYVRDTYKVGAKILAEQELVPDDTGDFEEV